MHLLPQDIKFEILARLPVKLLLSLKSVNKEWYALISDPEFAKLHLQYQNTTMNPNSMLQLYISSGNKLATLEFQRGNVDIIYKEWLSPGGIHMETTVKMWDSELDVESYPIAGSSNGLICYISGTQQKHLCLCNPATRQQRLIAGPINDTSYIALRWGFGYDSSSDDYKTVLVAKFGSETQKDQAGDQQTWKTFLNLRGLTRYFSGADRVYPKLFELKDGSNKVLIFETSVWSVLAADPRGEIYLPPRQVFLNFRRRASFPDYLPDYLLSYTESLVSLSLWKEWTTVKKDAPLKLESNCKKARYR